MQAINNLWDDICNLIIRPQRANYDPSISLGPRLFTLNNKIYERRDCIVKNDRDMELQCSLYQPIDSQRVSKKLPCVIYCHGNCGSRVDALDAVQLLLPSNIMVFAFDFAGSGLSDGEHVTLGFYEQQDLLCVVTFLQETGMVSKIGLWGRSMGAATSLMFVGRDPSSISALVADSAFCSLELVISDLVHNFQSWIPNPAIKIATQAMRKSISQKAKFDISSNCPINFVGKIKIPGLFGHAETDNFVKKKHSETLYDKYGGDKTLIFFEGDHNTSRPDFFLDQILIHFEQHLLPKKDSLSSSTNIVNSPKVSTSNNFPIVKPIGSTGNNNSISSGVGIGGNRIDQNNHGKTNSTTKETSEVSGSTLTSSSSTSMDTPILTGIEGNLVKMSLEPVRGDGNNSDKAVANILSIRGESGRQEDYSYESIGVLKKQKTMNIVYPDGIKRHMSSSGGLEIISETEMDTIGKQILETMKDSTSSEK